MLRHIYKIRYVLAIVLTVITITLSVLPADNLSQTGFINIPFGDKISHAIAYLSLGFSWSLACDKQKYSQIKVLLFLFLLGLGLEMTQFYFLSGRYFEIFDIIANIIGAIGGITIKHWIFNDFDGKTE
jgi:VanZ family protein